MKTKLKTTNNLVVITAALATFLSAFAVVSAHSASNVSVFATGLNNPRGLRFGPDGNLYVAEGGTGGKDSTIGTCLQVPFPVGPYHGSTTGGRISRINHSGTRTTVTDQLPSSSANEIVGGS